MTYIDRHLMPGDCVDVRTGAGYAGIVVCVLVVDADDPHLCYLIRKIDRHGSIVAKLSNFVRAESCAVIPRRRREDAHALYSGCEGRRPPIRLGCDVSFVFPGPTTGGLFRVKRMFLRGWNQSRIRRPLFEQLEKLCTIELSLMQGCRTIEHVAWQAVQVPSSGHLLYMRGRRPSAADIVSNSVTETIGGSYKEVRL